MRKKILFIIILSISFVLGSCTPVYAQNGDISLPRETAGSALKALKLVPALESEITELKKLVKELEAQKVTPCSVALADAERLIVAIPFGEPTDTKAMQSARKEQRKLVKTLIVNSVKSQCQWRDSPKWYLELLKFAPLAGAILLK